MVLTSILHRIIQDFLLHRELKDFLMHIAFEDKYYLAKLLKISY